MTESDAADTHHECIEVEEGEDGRLLVTIRPKHRSALPGWPEAAEDLDLLGPGPKEANGVEVIEEVGLYHDEDDDYPWGYEEVTLAFEDIPALRSARDQLYDKATERFEWGDADGGEDVQTFAGRLPTDTEVAHHV